MSGLPEPGPARDRLVAEVVGWDATEPGWCWDADLSVRRSPSTSPADALAALLAWKGLAANRAVSIEFTYDGQVWVELFEEDAYHRAHEPTLPSAATAALLATGEG